MNGDMSRSPDISCSLWSRRICVETCRQVSRYVDACGDV